MGGEGRGGGGGEGGGFTAKKRLQDGFYEPVCLKV